jgi:putative transposase
MTRPLRAQYEGATLHIFNRGDQGDAIFEKEHDKAYFLSLLEAGADKYSISIQAYCLMINHYHLILRIKKCNLSDFMHFLGSSYGNRLSRQGWIGHVFAGRYKSICVEEERYLLALSRYVHRNPIEAGLVSHPRDYPWSSYRFYESENPVCPWIEKEWLLDYFGTPISLAMRRYCEYIEGCLDEDSGFPDDQTIGRAILGSPDFLKVVLERVPADKDLNEVTNKRRLSKLIGLDLLESMVLDHFGLEDLNGNDLTGNGSREAARCVFALLSREFTSAVNKEIARKLGISDPSGITQKVKRTRRKLDSDTQLDCQMKQDVQAMRSKINRLISG